MKPSLLFGLPFALLAAPAFAQDAVTGIDAHGFNLAAFTGDPRAPLQVQRPARFEQWDVFLGGVFEYAHEPLLYVTEVAGQDPLVTPVLDNVVALNLSGGVALADWLRIDAALPLYFTSTGLDTVSNGFGVGDTRVAAMFEVVRPKDGASGGFGLGVVPFLDIPTGDADVFLGQGGVTGGGKLAATYEAGSATIGGEAGVQFQPEVTELDNLIGSDRVLVGGHLGYLFSPSFGANLEGKVFIPFSTNEEVGSETPAELTLSLNKRLESGAHFLAGGSTAVSLGASAADFRVFLGGGFGTAKRIPVIADCDSDRILDDVDQCRCEAETYDGRHDDDGCPEKPATLAVSVTYEGQPISGAAVELKGGAAPMSATSTGSPWTVDAEPARRYDAAAKLGSCLAGTNTVTTAEEGRTDLAVPLTPVLDAYVIAEVVSKRTGKPIPDATVAWTSEGLGCVPKGAVAVMDKVAVGAGKHTAAVAARCFRSGGAVAELAAGETRTVRIELEALGARVTEKGISLSSKVFFDVAKTTIKPESDQILSDIAQVLIANPAIELIELGGHTDSDGSDDYNQKLSQGRVEAVREVLVQKGVSASRLKATGYGEKKPVDPRSTAAAKAKNRRVELNFAGKVPPPTDPCPE